MPHERTIPMHLLTDLIERWKSSIHVEDIGGANERESVRAFTLQKCIEELESAIQR